MTDFSDSAVTIEIMRYGVCVRDPLQIKQFNAVAQMARALGATHLHAGIATALRQSFVFTSPANAAKWCAEIEASIARITADPALRWVRGTDTGLSARSILAAAGTGQAAKEAEHVGARGDTPRDADDFGRCSRLLARVPDLRERLPLVAERWPAWAPLVAVWDELETLLQTDPQILDSRLWALGGDR
jgi:hypothetical protein